MKSENYLIKSKKKHFYKNEIHNLKNRNSVEKNSCSILFYKSMKMNFYDLVEEKNSAIFLGRKASDSIKTWLSICIVQKDHENDASRNCSNFVKNLF